MTTLGSSPELTFSLTVTSPLT
ncbi:hypothetical protein LINGRAPRIM_LOCUS2511 [Linum grandiflorum]